MRIIDFLDRSAKLYPKNICIRDLYGYQTYSFEETVELSHRIASALLRCGIKPGDSVAVLSPNDPLGYACMMGLFRANAAWIPVNGRNPLRENESVLRSREVAWLFYHPEYEQQAMSLRVAIPSIRGTVCIHPSDAADHVLAEWMAPPHCARVDLEAGRNDLTAIVSTGGTTGEPKGAMLAHRSFETMVETFLTYMPIKQPSTHLVVAPMTHGAGATTFPMLACGATQIFMAKADPAEILSTFEREKITHVFMPPTLLYMLLAHSDLQRHDYRTLRCLLLGAAPVAAEKLREAVGVFGPVVAQCYGQVEAPMVCTFFSPQELAESAVDHPERLRSCGRPTRLTELAILDEAGRQLPSGQTGEIAVRGDLVMSGYHHDPVGSAQVALHGWHHTGDIGMLDDAGFLYIVDRKRDLIITGGFNVYPLEVEQVLLAHPAIQDAAVIGVPDDKWGEAVKAVVQTKPGRDIGTEELMAWCRDGLGGVKMPKTIEIWPDLPRSAVGKVLKKSIRQKFWEGRDRLT